MDERHKIVTVLDALGMKIKTGQTKKKLLEELFHTLLYRLMTAQIRVHAGNRLDLRATRRG
jgi:type I restriction enzyme S subunit